MEASVGERRDYYQVNSPSGHSPNRRECVVKDSHDGEHPRDKRTIYDPGCRLSLRSLLSSIALGCMLGVLGSGTAAAQSDVMGGTLEKIFTQDKLICGVSTGVPGFSTIDELGNYRGFDVDFCRALAAALLGDDSKVEYVPLGSQERFDALASGEIDVLARNTTWTLTRDIDRLMDFAAINFYDGQGFLVRADSGIESPLDLGGKTICVQIDTTSEMNLSDYALQNDLKLEKEFGQTLAPLVEAYLDKSCDAITTDSSALAGIRAQFASPEQHKILTQTISKEPLAIAVRQGDDELRDITAWTVYAMIGAEELGISQSNVEDLFNTTKNREQRRFLGVIDAADEGKPTVGAILSLSNDWAYNVIRQVGNYADVFANNLGPETSINLDRGLNDLASNGGILYAPPLR